MAPGKSVRGIPAGSSAEGEVVKQSVISTILAILVGGSVAGIIGLALPDVTAANAAATAWRTGERVILSSTHDSAAAIVIPVLGIDSCIGVLAFEVPDGREHDAATHAVGAIIAAQLATIVPTASTERATEPEESGPVEPKHESRVQSA